METLSLGFALPLFDANFGDLRLVAAAVFLGMLTGGCAAGDARESVKLTSSPVKTGPNAPERKLVLIKCMHFQVRTCCFQGGQLAWNKGDGFFLVVGGICFVFVELVGCFSFQIITILNLKDCNLFEG